MPGCPGPAHSSSSLIPSGVSIVLCSPATPALLFYCNLFNYQTVKLTPYSLSAMSSLSPTTHTGLLIPRLPRTPPCPTAFAKPCLDRVTPPSEPSADVRSSGRSPAAPLIRSLLLLCHHCTFFPCTALVWQHAVTHVALRDSGELRLCVASM